MRSPGVERWPFAELRLGHQLNEIGAVVTNVANALILLRHKFRRVERTVIAAWQQGHRDRRLARATARRRRMVAIEFGTWRSGRSGGAAGSVTVGNGKFFEPPGGTRS